IHATPGTFKLNPTNGFVDGRNHDIYGNLISGSRDSVAPIRVLTPGDAANVIAGTKDTTTNIIGTPKVKVDPNIPDPAVFGNAYKTIADYIITDTITGKNAKPYPLSP